MTRLTVITPTRGRLSLRRTIQSIAPQLADGDEHLVIGDGPQVGARRIVEACGGVYHQGPATATYGAHQRDYGIAHATGDYVMFCDDDDILTDGALAVVRAGIADNPGVPLLFRMDVPGFGVLWHDPVIRHGNVGTPMIVAPRDGRLADWASSPEAYTADLWFIARTVANHGGAVVWCEEVICQCRTQQWS